MLLFIYFNLKDICQRPTFIANGASRFDVEQGELGDPWYLSLKPVFSCNLEMTCRPLFGGHFRLIPHPIITDDLLESSPFTRIAKDYTIVIGRMKINCYSSFI
jgi:hypothetical protein